MKVKIISIKIPALKIKYNDIKKTRDVKPQHQLFTYIPISARTLDLDYNNLLCVKDVQMHLCFSRTWHPPCILYDKEKVKMH